MSLEAGSEVEEVQDDPSLVDESADQSESLTSGGENLSDAQPEEGGEEAAEFDPAHYEQSFGLPPGSLKDVKDAESALEAVRQFTDKSLIAGLQYNPTQAAHAATEEDGEPATKPEKGKEPKGVESEVLKRLEAMEARFQQQEKAAQTQTMQELDRRINARIDSWKSEKYGVGQSRNYKQLKATQGLRELLRTQAAGLMAQNQPIPVVEALLDRVRVFDDDTYKPTIKKPTGATALGTPGAGNQKGQPNKKPRNIHEAAAINYWSVR